MGTIGSPLLVPRLQLPTAPLKLSFIARRSGGKRKTEEATDETHRVKADTSPPSVGSPPRSHAHREAAQGGEEEAEGVGRSAAEEATLVEVMWTPPASLPSPPQEDPGRELFPVGQDPVLPGAGRAEQQEPGRDESAGLAEELLATARRVIDFLCQSLAGLSRRAAERLQGVPSAGGRLEQLESQLAKLEAQNRLLERQWAKTEKELAKEKRGLEKEVRALKHDLAACDKANADLQKGRDAAEAREGATEDKLRLERQAREGAEARLAEALEALGRFTGKVDAILATFEPEGMAVAEDLEARLEAARERLEGFARKVAESTAQYTLGLVKSHFSEADLEPVGDGIAPDTSDLAWSD
ncbi:uncharacterized protein LOC120652614 [Panicum virgatum]|uniref:uncharacterized protein LOC120652614 n=1 Tax=Panicum virgatum TaxID=38727 RepID=UPI0019D58D77|nr:uncharacterized protein LOC120652614 [Panicum virgatum]